MMKMFSRLKERIGCLIFYYNDYLQLMKSHSQEFALSNLERQMLLISHTLEKGMSFDTKKHNWGGGKCAALCNIIDRYIALGGAITDQFILALNVVNCYTLDEYACKDDTLLSRIKKLTTQYSHLLQPDSTGLKQVCEPPVFDCKQIESFFNSRSSVRYFSDQPISEDEILKASDFASYTPTACNRQTSRVYAYRDKAIIGQILNNQLGDQGWCGNADTLFVITGNQTYFGTGYERHQVLIDGGLFAMNFDYGLHLQHIGSCFKMFVREQKREDEFRKICSIPANEIPIVLILAGHYQKSPIHSPKSHRFKVPTFIDGKQLNM